MGELVNLRGARKQKKRKEAERHAAANRLAFGRSKADRAHEQSQSEKARAHLDRHRLRGGDER